jgi:EAL domain-containing protein (putative c-di-GMP-specific phosphodiesterase class I)
MRYSQRAKSIAHCLQQPKPIDFTVAIPVFNGEHRLPLVLEKLRQQTGVKDLQWEVLVLDNNSSDNTQAVVQRYQKTCQNSFFHLKYHFVARQGAAFARQRAMEVARGKLVGFLDDDNLPALDWVVQAYQFAQAHPQVGAFGSRIQGDFESEDSAASLHPWFKPYLALIKRSDSPCRYAPEKKILPPGAGLVVRQQAWLATVPRYLFLNHTSKAAGLASEDLEALLHIQKGGWDIWHNPQMLVHHRVPDTRLQQAYLVSLCRCIGLSCAYIRWLRMSPWQRPLVMPLHILNDSYNLLVHSLKDAFSADLNMQRVCEQEHLRSSLMSPAFLLKKAGLDAYQTCLQQIRFSKADRCLSQLETAFEQDHFKLYCQSVLPLGQQPSQQSLDQHYEVLLRLAQQTDQGSSLLSPAYFMPIAEQYNLTRTLDRWVIRQFAQFQTQQPASDQSRYAINLSAATVGDRNFTNFLGALLDQSPGLSGQLCFEVSEKIALSNFAIVRRLAHELQEMGCHLAIDGITLKRDEMEQFTLVPLSYLKIGGGAVQKLLQRSRLMTALSHLQQLQQTINAPVVANYLEQQGWVTQVQNHGISYGQGYSLAYPEPLLPPASEPSIGN